MWFSTTNLISTLEEGRKTGAVSTRWACLDVISITGVNFRRKLISLGLLKLPTSSDKGKDFRLKVTWKGSGREETKSTPAVQARRHFTPTKIPRHRHFCFSFVPTRCANMQRPTPDLRVL